MENDFMSNSNTDENSTNNSTHGDYSAPDSYDADAAYGFAPSGTGTSESTGDPYGQPQQNRGYNLNGQYYTNSSGSYGSTSQNSTDGYQYNNGNYSAGMNALPPVNKKGQPVPNNFAMKLTFAIIELLVTFVIMTSLSIWGIITLVLAIFALISVCLQNKEYNAQNWNSFLLRRNVSNVLLWVTFGMEMLWIVLIVVGLIILMTLGPSFINGLTGNSDSILNPDSSYHSDYYGNEDGVSDELQDLLDDLHDMEDGDEEDGDDDAEIPDGFIEDMKGEKVPTVQGFEKFTLSDTTFTLPVSCRDFLAAGFYFSDDADDTLEPGEENGFTYYDAEGDYRGTVFIHNITDKKIKAKDGMIGAITINNLYKDDLELVGGLDFDSSLEDCADELGSKVTSVSVGSAVNTYSWWFEEGGYFTSIQVDFTAEEEIQDVWIVNTADWN